MDSAIKTLQSMANTAMPLGIAAAFVAMLCALWMLRQAVKHTEQGNATKQDALFLAFSSPGFSRLAIFNYPDTIGIAVYAALALEQVGAINDAKDYIEVSRQLYPDWPPTYLAAARYYALSGDQQKAQELLQVAKTLMEQHRSPKHIQPLNIEAVEGLVAAGQRAEPTTTLDSMFADIQKKPLQLVMVRSVTILFIGLGFTFAGFLLHAVLRILAQN